MSLKKIIFPILLFFFSVTVLANNQNIETIVVIRHAEKSAQDLGQLNCKGLNRSMLLPVYFATHFPNPNYIFASNPSIQNKHFSYVRPLATIEPTAISLNMPVNAQIGFNQPDQLMNQLLLPQYHQALIYVAWEHHNIETFAKDILKYFHHVISVPSWPADEYNRVYVFTIRWDKNTIQFSQTSEGLVNINPHCVLGHERHRNTRQKS